MHHAYNRLHIIVCVGSECSPETSDLHCGSCHAEGTLDERAFCIFTCCVQHFNDALKIVQQADVKGATAQVKHKDGCSF